MSERCLDRPIWSALTTRQAAFARGNKRALAFCSDVAPFAAAVDDSPASREDLKRLAEDDVLLLMQRERCSGIHGLQLITEAAAVQMVAGSAVIEARAAEAVRLGEQDATAMFALAKLAKPGPFRIRTHELGQYWGIRRDGQLVAMAGERLKLPGFSEVSGICTHPDWRELGLAKSLSSLVASKIRARGETPFLHVYADNERAIALYQALGFSIRAPMYVQTFSKYGRFAGAPSGDHDRLCSPFKSRTHRHR